MCWLECHQGAQQSLEKFTQALQPGKASLTTSTTTPSQNEGVHRPFANFQEKLDRQLEAWRQNSAWIDEVPPLEVSSSELLISCLLQHLVIIVIYRLFLVLYSNHHFCDGVCPTDSCPTSA